MASCTPAQDGVPVTYDCDISHRGGRPGFVVASDHEITVPDFSGNLYFDTLGNFSVHPYAALLFIDFSTGDLVHIRGRVEIFWNDPPIAGYSGRPKGLAITCRRWILGGNRVYSVRSGRGILALRVHDRTLGR
ncbi:pyridoxamine 5'-phosphate oxidase family protein [Bradyrhizobium sp. WSM2793]|uniref:pyridoxamine 5'-phosphate oxidase family protein n=1 Tax=Bradyrhizobium sp. WSM2793 TaxID=1038866 RepID=UPI0035285657